MKGDEPFSWDALVPHIVHPLKVAIIEALRWIEEPLSAIDLTRIGAEKHGLSRVSYHLVKLAEVGAIEVVGSRPVPGSLERLYAFA